MVADALTTIFAAIADPTRRAILARLEGGEATVTELAAPFAMSMPAISKHLKVLERAGLIERGRDAQRRPCRLCAAPLRDAADWIERYRTQWEQRLDRLEAWLDRVQSERAPAERPPAERPPTEASRSKEKKHVRKPQ